MITTPADQRQQRAIEQRSNYTIFETFGSETGWTVQKIYGEEAGHHYEVEPCAGTCTCPDSRKNPGRRCKHVWMVMNDLAQKQERRQTIEDARRMIELDFPQD